MFTEFLNLLLPDKKIASQQAIEAFMADAFQTADSAYITKVLGVFARAKGMKQIAEETGLLRELTLPSNCG